MDILILICEFASIFCSSVHMFNVVTVFKDHKSGKREKPDCVRNNHICQIRDSREAPIPHTCEFILGEFFFTILQSTGFCSLAFAFIAF